MYCVNKHVDAQKLPQCTYGYSSPEPHHYRGPIGDIAGARGGASEEGDGHVGVGWEGVGLGGVKEPGGPVEEPGGLEAESRLRSPLHSIIHTFPLGIQPRALGTRGMPVCKRRSARHGRHLVSAAFYGPFYQHSHLSSICRGILEPWSA